MLVMWPLNRYVSLMEHSEGPVPAVARMVSRLQ